VGLGAFEINKTKKAKRQLETRGTFRKFFKSKFSGKTDKEKWHQQVI
jgi:hypothetical protein